MSESVEDNYESEDQLVELGRSPTTSATQNGDVDDVFLFDNNIPSIATRISARAEPADTLALRRRNRLLRLISDPRACSRGLQRSVSVQLDDRRRRHHSDDLPVGSSENGEHLSLFGDLDGQRQSVVRGRGSQSRRSMINGSWRARGKNRRSVDACCSGDADAATAKRRVTLTAVNTIFTADDDDLNLNSDDDYEDEFTGHVCNGLDDQPTINSSDCSNKAN